jgi:hypothetical protein
MRLTFGISMMKKIIVLLSFFAWAFLSSSCATYDDDPWKAEPWLTVHFEYPFGGERGAGKIESGIEIRRDPDGGSIGYIMLFPNGGEPRKLYLQNDVFDRFVGDWNSIKLMEFSQKRFDDSEIQVVRNGEELVQMAPFDDRTLIVTERQGDQVVTLSIYAPDYFADTHQERSEGKALRAALDLFARVIGESIL